MWAVLKAELNDNRQICFYILLASVFSFGILHNWPLLTGEVPENPNIGYISIAHIYFFFFGAILFTWYWSKRVSYRRQILLPFTARKVGIMRLLIFTSYWLLVVLIIVLDSFISKYYIMNSVMVRSILTQTGMALIAYSLFFFWQDLRDFSIVNNSPHGTGNRRYYDYLMFVLIALISFVAMAGIIHTYQGKGGSDYDWFLTWLYQSNSGILSSLLIGFLLSYVSIITFQKRKCYSD